jgi:hypothetical protein
MRSALLCASIAERLFKISRLSHSAECSKRIFTGGVVTVNSICSAAFCESAALRELLKFSLPLQSFCPLNRMQYGKGVEILSGGQGEEQRQTAVFGRKSYAFCRF